MAAGEIPVEFVFESSNIFAINDILPQAPTHILVIPKAHHENAAELSANSPEVIAEMHDAGAKIAADFNPVSYTHLTLPTKRIV